MVESQQGQDDDAIQNDDESDLPAYLASDYLDQCDLYNSGEDNESNNRSSPALSNYSRPVSR